MLPMKSHAIFPQVSRAKKHSDKKKQKVRAKYYSQSSSSEEDQSSFPVKKSAKPFCTLNWRGLTMCGQTGKTV